MNISETDVINAVFAVAGERPDHVYEAPNDTAYCLYVHRDDNGALIPGCLFGTALHRLGVSLETLRMHEGFGIVPVLMRHLGIDISYATRIKLEAVQREQDNGEPWGEAVKELDA